MTVTVSDVDDDAGGGTHEARDATEQSDGAILADLRHARQARRLGDTEWFDVLYRVYLFALGGLIAVVVASDAVEGLVDDGVTTNALLTRGPSIAGVVVALACAIGLRNGADGGPVSVESADIRHLLLSPIDRRRVLLRPIVQRLRSVAFAPAIVLAIIGQLVAREVEGSRAAWAASSALFGMVVGVVYVSIAVVSHALRVRRGLASVLGGALVAWQSAVAIATWEADVNAATNPLGWIGRHGPTDLAGSLLFWGIRQRALDAVALLVVAVLAGVAVTLGGRLRLDPLERRGQLVSQLRFAATVQDIRTVVLLRRQLRAEAPRTRPWGRSRHPDRSHDRHADRAGPRRSSIPTSTGGSLSPTLVWRRGVASLRRLPASRLIRIMALAAGAGVAASLTVTSSPVAAVAAVGCLFLLGLEAIEPLAQEIDRPDITDSIPVSRGWLFAHHLAAPAVLLMIASMIGAAAATVLEPSHAAAAFAIAIPVTWAGAMGPIVSTVRDAPQPLAVASTTLMGGDKGGESPFAVPEFAGASNIITGLVPIIFSAVAAGPIFAMRSLASSGTVARSWIGVVLLLAVMVVWIVRRDNWAIKIRGFFEEGRNAQ